MKVSQIKSKVEAKVAKGKAKVAAKCGNGKAAKCAAVLTSLLASAFLIGCQNPAQRAQTAETRLTFNINEGASGTTFNFGNEFVSLAQSNETGGNDAGQTASPTTETKPEIAVGVGGSSAGVGGTSGASKQGVGAAIGGAVDAVGGMFSSSLSATDASAEPTAQQTASQTQQTLQTQQTSAACPGGVCGQGQTSGDCPGGCADRSDG